MNSIILIISLFLLFYSGYQLYLARHFTKQSNLQLEAKQEQLKQKISNLEEQKQTLTKNFISTQTTLTNLKQEVQQKEQRRKGLDKEIEQKRSNLKKLYQDLEDSSLSAYYNYERVIDNTYTLKEKQFQQKIKDIEMRKSAAENELTQIRNVIQAATAARLREQEEDDKKKFYSIQLTSNQMDDIQHLWELRKTFHEPTILSKLIWSSYIIKPTSDLCNRVLKSSKPVIGIYKITNISTGDSYIGQSVDIATRWKTHIKSGLGIDASSTNKLYQAMQVYCIWNFSFQLLQECTRDKLNEKEKFWIDFYQSNKVGYNVTKGNK